MIEYSYDEIGLEAAKRIGAQINPYLMEHAIACSAPIIMEKKTGFGGGVSGGSCALIKTPKRTFGVTAYHVLKEAIEFSKSEVGRVLIGQAEVRNFGDLMISYSEEMDIATFTLPKDALPYIRAKRGWECRFSAYWPPNVPDPECNVFFCGWPAAIRDVTGGFLFRPFTGVCLTHSKSEERFTIQRDAASETVDGPREAAPINFNAGGASGGPMFSLININGFIRPVFSGVIIEAHAGWGVIVGARADCIDDFGIVDSRRPV